MKKEGKIIIKERVFLETNVLSFLLFLVSILIVISMVFLLSSCGGGSAGSADTSEGVGKLTSNLSLYADKMVTKTENIITFQAVLYDGNGNPLPDKDISFDIVSGTASLSSNLAKTDSRGIAYVNLSSTSADSNIVVVKASYGLSAQDTKTVYFVDSVSLQASLYLIPDGDNDGVYGEISDYIVKSGDSSTTLKAVYVNIAEQPEPGVTILFGSDSEHVSFSKNPAVTDHNGVAYTTMNITGISEKQIITIYGHNINNGVADIISINVMPVLADSISLTSSAYTVEARGTLDIVACVFSENGTPVPDGNIIRYSLSPYNSGNIEETFGYTTNGCHKTTFTAGNINGEVSITASSGGVSDSIDIVITKPASQLQVYPQTATTSINTPISFVITGGTAPYTVIADTASATVTPSTVTREGGTFTATSSVAETVTITIIDAYRQTATVTLNVTE